MSATRSAIEISSSAAQRIRPTIIPLSELATANRQRDALYQLSEQLHVAGDLEETCEAAMDAIGSALECDRSSILLFDEAGVMRFVASRELSSSYRNAVTGHSPWKLGDTDAMPIDMPDVEASSLPADLKAIILGEGIRACAFIPLVSDGAIIGKFMAYFREPHSFSRDDLSVSLAIARQLAFSIRRIRTDRQLREREQQLADELSATRRLQELSIEMAHEADVQALYEKFIDAAMDIMHADHGSMQQYYAHLGTHGELKLLAHRGFTPEAARHWTWVRADSPTTCGMAITARQRTICNDVEQDPLMAGTTDLACFRASGIRAIQTTPLLSRRGELVGMISTQWSECREPTERELRLLDILARLAADLVERKTHDEEARRREERLRILTQLLTDVPWQSRSDGAFADLQLAWENYTGQSWDEHAGHGWFDAIHPEDREKVQTSWSSACFDANGYECRARLWHAPSRQYRQMLFRATPIRNEDGSVREWVGSCTEVDS